MTEPDPLLTRLASLGPDEWRPEPPPGLDMPPGTEPAPRRRRSLTVRPIPAIAVALLLLAAGAGGAVIVGNRDADAGRTLALAPLARGDSAAGKVRIDRAGGRATLVVSDLAPSRRGEFYELWLLSPPGDLVSLGSFRVGAGGGATLELPVPVDPSRYRFLDVSVEPDDGDPSHSARSVLRGRT